MIIIYRIVGPTYGLLFLANWVMIILQLDLLGFNFVLATGFSSIKKEFGKGFKGSAIGFQVSTTSGSFPHMEII